MVTCSTSYSGEPKNAGTIAARFALWVLLRLHGPPIYICLAFRCDDRQAGIHWQRHRALPAPAKVVNALLFIVSVSCTCWPGQDRLESNLMQLRFALGSPTPAV